MKKTLLISLITLISLNFAYAQNIVGSWRGSLKIQNVELRIVFNISLKDSIYIATMDSPDQGVKGIPVESVMFTNNMSLKIVHPPLMMEYNGVYLGDKIIGTFNQAGMTVPLELTSAAEEGPKRPQEPKAPFPYNQEEVLIINRVDSIVLSGTFTYPHDGGKHKAVVLISGSGPQNRDSEIMGHKTFHVLADYLTRNGTSVLRVDDRGVGKSGGTFANSTSLDFARDVKSAVEYLKGRSDVSEIGLIGHSEGGAIAPMVASECSDVSFIVLMAAPGVTGREIIVTQSEHIYAASGMAPEQIGKVMEVNKAMMNLVTPDKDVAIIEKELYDLIKNLTGSAVTDQEIKRQIAQVTTPWMRYFLNHDPRLVLAKVKCPVLAINGTKDLQVASKTNLDAIYLALTGEKRDENNSVTRYNNIVTIIEFEGLNHLFQKCETGLPMEYSKIEETINPEVLTAISNWIKGINE